MTTMTDPDELAAAAVIVSAFPNDERWTGTEAAIVAISAALRIYGDERAKQERERAAQTANQYRYPRGGGSDEERGAYIMRDYIAAVIRALD